MKRLSMLLAVAAALVATVPAPAPPSFAAAEAAGKAGPTLVPLPVAPGVQLHTLGFAIRTPWMSGTMELRMPETIHSSMGLHFIDHNRADMPPLGTIAPAPVWRQDPGTGKLSYEARTSEGLVFGATATPNGPRVLLAFRIRNETGKPLRHVSSQQCLVLSKEPQFGRRNALDTTYTWVGGKWQCLNRTTPTAAEKGRDLWILMPVAGGPPDLGGQKEMPGAWWVVNQVADDYLVARQSDDGKHLVGITWFDVPPGLLMSNTRIPCLHAGPMQAVDLEPGATHVWRGVIYVMENDPGRLKVLFRQDWDAFRSTAGASGP